MPPDKVGELLQGGRTRSTLGKSLSLPLWGFRPGAAPARPRGVGDPAGDGNPSGAGTGGSP